VTRLLAAAMCAAVLAAPAAARAATVLVGPDKLVSYTAAPGEANRLSVDQRAGVATFRDSGAPIVAGPGCAARAGGAVACTTGSRYTPWADVDLGDGDDVLRKHHGGMLATLGAGADRASADAGRLQVEGGPGPDAISGSPHAAVEVDYYDHAVGVRVTLDDRANDGAPGEGDDIAASVRAVGGTSHADVLDGRRARGHIVLSGSFGNDRLYAAPAGGVLDGGTGADVLHGGPGRDRLYGEEGDDVVSGRAGDDLLGGLSGRNVLTGGPGHDRFEVTALGDDDIRARDGERDVVACTSLPVRMAVDTRDRLMDCAPALGVGPDPPGVLVGRRLRLALVCRRPRAVSCRGTVRLTDSAPRALARVPFRIAAGTTVHVTVRLGHEPRNGLITAVAVNHRARPPASSRTTVSTFEVQEQPAVAASWMADGHRLRQQ
jgi:hypothetical protein